MASPTQFEQYVADEIKKYKDVCFPIHSSWLRRLLVRHLACTRLHPNPEDEFCMPSIGPSQRIISEYMKAFRHAAEHGDEFCEEPVMVERIYPDGYMILNGHHRWAAAMRLGYRKIRVKVVNLTQESDIQKGLSKTRNTKRVTFDLDEVVLREQDGTSAELSLPFPLNRLYREPIRKGIPALFSFLSANGYDIWVYTNGYYSFEHIRTLFRLHHARVTGVITGMARKAKVGANMKKKVDAMMAGKYQTTLHIDDAALLRTTRNSKQYEDYSLDPGADWAQQIMDIVRKIEKNEA